MYILEGKRRNHEERQREVLTTQRVYCAMNSIVFVF